MIPSNFDEVLVDVLALEGDASIERLEVAKPLKELRLENCPNLKTLIVPHRVEHVFIYNCPSLKLVNLPYGVHLMRVSDCSNLEVLVSRSSHDTVIVERCRKLLRLAVASAKMLFVFDCDELVELNLNVGRPRIAVCRCPALQVLKTPPTQCLRVLEGPGIAKVVIKTMIPQLAESALWWLQPPEGSVMQGALRDRAYGSRFRPTQVGLGVNIA